MFAIAALLALAGVASAQYYNNQTDAFYLKVQSDNATLDGQYFASCHSGAAFEQLCLLGPGTPGQWDHFYFNYTEEFQQGGYLTWNMPTFGNNGFQQNVSEPLSLSFNPVSNVADLIFAPDFQNYFSISYDDDNKLYITSSPVDWEETTPSYTNYYNWQMCITGYGGYHYNALTWLTVGESINPTCQPVNVTLEYL